MCYDISFTVNVKQLSDYFPDLVWDPQLNLDYGCLDHIQGLNLFPEHPVIYIDDAGQLICKPMSWSIIQPDVTIMPSIEHRNLNLNIRAEKIIGGYWDKLKENVCLIPVTGIFEHHKVPKMTKRIPYFITVKDQPVFFLPGLYSCSELIIGDKQIIYHAFGMITIDASSNSSMTMIHNAKPKDPRMPLFLTFELAKRIISPKMELTEYKEILNYKIGSNQLSFHTVDSIRGGKERKDGKQKHEYYHWGISEQTSLF